MLLPLPLLTGALPLELEMTGGVSAGSATTYEFWPYEHAMTGSALVGADPVISAISQVGMTGGVSAGAASTLVFESASTYEHDMVGKVVVGAAATWAFDGTVILGLTAGSDTEVELVDAPAYELDATLPAGMTSSFTAHTYQYLDAQLPRFTGDFVGVPGNIGAIDARLPATLTSAFFTGAALETSLPFPLTSSFTGYPAGVGALDLSLFALTGAFSGTVTTVGTFSGQLVLPTGAFAGVVGQTAALDLTLRPMYGLFTGSVGAGGVLAAPLPTLVAAITGYTTTYGTLTASFPRTLTASFASFSAWSYVDTLSTNTVSFAATQYENYGFNSFAEIGGRFFGLKADGLYAVHEGELDQAAEIPARFGSGCLDYGVMELKRPENVYATYSSTAPLTVTITPDKQVSYSYRLPSGKGEFGQRRAGLGKGQRGRFWKYEVSNIAGGDFTFADIDLVFAQTARRI